MSEHYDVAVIGMQPAGLVAAGILARAGRRVVLVDHGEQGQTYQHRGWRLPLAPAVLPERLEGPQVKRVHEVLGLTQELRTRAVSLTPAFQLITPRHRVDIAAEREAQLAELAREFPAQVEVTRRFFVDLDVLDSEAGTLLGRRLPLVSRGAWSRICSRLMTGRERLLGAAFQERASVAALDEQDLLRTLLLGPLAFVGHLDDRAPSTLHAARLLAPLFHGVMEVRDDPGGLTALLLTAAERAGVEVRRQTIVRELSTRGRRLTTLILEGGAAPVTADYFLGNAAEPLAELLSARSRPRAFLLEEQRAQPTGSLFVVNIVAKQEVIPRGMAKIAFVVNGRRSGREGDPADDLLLVRRYNAVRVGSGGELTTSPEHVVLCAATPVRTAEVAHTPTRVARLRTQVLEQLERVVPFLEQLTVDVSVVSDTASWDVDSNGGARRVDPWRLHPRFEGVTPPRLGVGIRPLRTYFKNLVHCGRDVLPGLGLEGEYATGWSAAQLLGKLAGKAWTATGITIADDRS